MENKRNDPVNTEVFRFLKKVKVEEQDAFLRAVIAHIKSIQAPTAQDVREFFSKIWKGARAHENAARAQLGGDF